LNRGRHSVSASSDALSSSSSAIFEGGSHDSQGDSHREQADPDVIPEEYTAEVMEDDIDPDDPYQINQLNELPHEHLKELYQ